MSFENVFKEEMERSDLKLSLLNMANDSEKTLVPRPEDEFVTLNRQSDSYIMSPKYNNSELEFEKRTKNNSVNCYYIHDLKCDFVEDDNNNLTLHRSSTSMSFTNHEVYSKDDYNHILNRNDNILINKSIPMKQFPRRQIKVNTFKTDDSIENAYEITTEELSKSELDKEAYIDYEIEEPATTPIEETLLTKKSDNFLVLYNVEHKIDFAPKIVETYSSEDIINVEHVIQTLNDTPSTSYANPSKFMRDISADERDTIIKLTRNADFKQKNEIEPNDQPTIIKPLIYEDFLNESSSIDNIIGIVNYDDIEKSPWELQDDTELTNSGIKDEVIEFKKIETHSQTKFESNEESLSYLSKELLNSDYSFSHTFINNYLPAHNHAEENYTNRARGIKYKSNKLKSHGKMEYSNSCSGGSTSKKSKRMDFKKTASKLKVNSFSFDRQAPPALNLEHFQFQRDSSKKKVEYLNFETCTDCIEKNPMYIKISDLQASIKKLYLGDKTNNAPVNKELKIDDVEKSNLINFDKIKNNIKQHLAQIQSDDEDLLIVPTQKKAKEIKNNIKQHLSQTHPDGTDLNVVSTEKNVMEEIDNILNRMDAEIAPNNALFSSYETKKCRAECEQNEKELNNESIIDKVTEETLLPNEIICDETAIENNANNLGDFLHSNYDELKSIVQNIFDSIMDKKIQENLICNNKMVKDEPKETNVILQEVSESDESSESDTIIIDKDENAIETNELTLIFDNPLEEKESNLFDINIETLQREQLTTIWDANEKFTTDQNEIVSEKKETKRKRFRSLSRKRKCKEAVVVEENDNLKMKRKHKDMCTIS